MYLIKDKKYKINDIYFQVFPAALGSFNKRNLFKLANNIYLYY